jgi:glycosyltransferase involved in cell wall biosynthesis
MIKFAIVMATYHRSNNKSESYLMRSIKSVIDQTHQNWTLVIVSDKYEPEEELNTIINGFADERIILLKNYIVERDHIGSGYSLWCVAGANSVNMGLKYIRDNNYQYYCHLDDDDYWDTNHLSALAEAYTQFPKCVFANTQSVYQGGLLPNHTMDIFENNYPPRPCGMIHSSYSFRCDIIPFVYKTSLLNDSHFEPADAVMLGNIQLFIVGLNNLYCSIYVPKLTCHHDIEGESR